MIFGIYAGFLMVMVGLLISAVIVTLIMMFFGRSIIDSLRRLVEAFKKLFTKSTKTKVKEVHTIYEEDGVKKERIEVME